jgi:hypothetical protein
VPDTDLGIRGYICVLKVGLDDPVAFGLAVDQAVNAAVILYRGS